MHFVKEQSTEEAQKLRKEAEELYKNFNIPLNDILDNRSSSYSIDEIIFPSLNKKVEYTTYTTADLQRR
ncbi:MAG: hypothetical protein KJ799_16265 [Bacteroidetes bacterium]|nr:hypothetical protein [Bacteroidota bacterium]MBU1681028.1 hypothetical protein [Bacteroidota bacterium]MBU2508254.1 hypothetical protein [Bacteroidota bacterium]